MFAFQTKYDFTFLMSTYSPSSHLRLTLLDRLVSLLWGMIFIGVLQVFMPFNETTDLLMACGGAVLFSVFLVVDTQVQCLHLLHSQ